jgi:hypothetical protein
VTVTLGFFAHDLGDDRADLVVHQGDPAMCEAVLLDLYGLSGC